MIDRQKTRSVMTTLWPLFVQSIKMHWQYVAFFVVSVCLWVPLSTIFVSNSASALTGNKQKNCVTFYATVLFLVFLSSRIAGAGRKLGKMLSYPTFVEHIHLVIVNRILANAEYADVAELDENLGAKLHQVGAIAYNLSKFNSFLCFDVFSIIVFLATVCVYMLNVDRKYGLIVVGYCVLFLVAMGGFTVWLLHTMMQFYRDRRATTRHWGSAISNFASGVTHGTSDDSKNNLVGAIQTDTRNAFKINNVEAYYTLACNLLLVGLFGTVLIGVMKQLKSDPSEEGRKKASVILSATLLVVAYMSSMFDIVSDKSYAMAIALDPSTTDLLTESPEVGQESKKRPWSELKNPAALSGSEDHNARDVVAVVDNVSYRYRNGPAILNSCSLVIRKNRRILIYGPSGSGKSTLLKLMIQLHKHQSGTIIVDGVDVTQARKRDLRSRVLYTSQNTLLYPGTVFTNIVCGSGTTDVNKQTLGQFISSYGLDAVLPNLSTPVGNNADTGNAILSGGMTKLVLLLRTAIRIMPGAMFRSLFPEAKRTKCRPVLALFDEPLASLDKTTRTAVRRLLRDVTEGLSAIYISHVSDLAPDVDESLEFSSLFADPKHVQT